MSTLVPGTQGRAPRRARYLIPQWTPRRRELLAVLTLLGVLAGLLLAQVTLALALVLHATATITRWRPRWLILPAAGGAIAMISTGPGPALAGYAAVPHAVARTIAGMRGPAVLARAPGLLAALAHGLPGQFPVGLVAAAAAAAAAWWLRWLHTDEWALPAPRPGLVSVCRARATTAAIRSGSVLTRDGVRLGVDRASGAAVALSWQEAKGGVLVTGADAPAVQSSASQFLHAAIRRRKPVIAVDLSGSPGLAASVAVACAATDVPLQVFATDGNACYEPWRGGDPARTAALVMGLIDWGQGHEQARLSCRAWLAEVLAVVAAAPGDPGSAVLDEVAALLRPGALRARLERVPSYHPRRHVLSERAGEAASWVEADQATASMVAAQLRELRASPLGRWLCPGAGPAGAPGAAGTPTRIGLDDVARRRGVVLFSLDRRRHGRTADLIADLVALDLTGLCMQVHASGLTSDALAWFGGCGRADPALPAGLPGAGAGLAWVVATTSPAAAGGLAEQVSALVVHRLADPALAGRLSWLTGARLRPARPGAPVPGSHPFEPSAGHSGTPVADLGGAAPVGVPGFVSVPGIAGVPGFAGPVAPAGTIWSPVVTGETLCARGEGEFTLVAHGPKHLRRVIPLARAVPGRMPGNDGTPVRLGARLAPRESPLPAAAAPSQPGVPEDAPPGTAGADPAAARRRPW